MDKPTPAKQGGPSSTFYSGGRRKLVFQFSKDSKEKFTRFMCDLSPRQTKDKEVRYPKAFTKAPINQNLNLLASSQSKQESAKMASVQKSSESSPNYQFENIDSGKSTVSTLSPRTALTMNGKFTLLPKAGGNTASSKEEEEAIERSGANSHRSYSHSKFSEIREKKHALRFDSYGTVARVENEERSQLNGYTVPNTDRPEYSKKTATDWKKESQRISEFACVFKDLEPRTNPVYELVMPKDSPRREQKLQMNDGIVNFSLSVDNKRKVPKILPRLPENSADSREHTERSTYERARPENKFTWDTPSLLSPRPTKFEEATSLTTPKAFTFLEFMDKKEAVSPPKQIMRLAAINFTRRIKRFGADELSLGSYSLNSPRSQRGELKEGSNGFDPTVNLVGADNSELVNEFSPEALLNSLKKDLPNILTSVPSNRNEVMILDSWVNANLTKIARYSKLKHTDKLHCADDVYKTALNELIRQISCDCIERGELFMRIWQNYMDLFDDIVVQMRADFDQQMKKKNEEILQLQQKQAREIDVKVQEILKLNKDKESLQLQLQNVQHELRGAELRCNDTQDLIMRFKSDIGSMQKQFRILKREYQDILYKYNKIRDDREPKEDDEIDIEEIVMKKFQEFQATQTMKSLPESLSELKMYGIENYSPLLEDKLESMKPNFGTFVGKKIEYCEKETQMDADILQERIREVETQTSMALIDPKYDIVFEDMANLEEIVKEEQLKKQIKEERIHDLEEDLQEEIYNQEYQKLKMKLNGKGNKDPEFSDSQTDMSIYSENLTGPQQSNLLGVKSTFQKPTQSFGVASIRGSLDSLDAITNRESGRDESAGSSRQSLDGAINQVPLFKENASSAEGGRKKYSQSMNLDSLPEARAGDNELDTLSRANKAQNDSLASSDNAAKLQRKKPKIVVTLPPTKKYRGTLPMREVPEESPLTATKSPSLRRNTTTNIQSPLPNIHSPARKIQNKITNKVRSNQTRRLTSGSESLTNIRSLTNLREVLDEDSDSSPADDKLPQLDKEKVLASMTAQNFRYVRLMKLFKFERAKGRDLEHLKRFLALISCDNKSLYHEIKEVAQSIEGAMNDKVNKARILELLDEIEGMGNKLNDLGAIIDNDHDSSFVARGGMRATTTVNLPATPSKLQPQSQNTSIILDFENNEVKPQQKQENEKIVSATKRTRTHKSKTAKTRVSASMNNLQTSEKIFVPVPFGKRTELLSPTKKKALQVETVEKLKKLVQKHSNDKKLMSLKKVLKLLTSFTLEKISAGRENPNTKDQDMIAFVYTSLYNNYAVAKIAEAKFITFMVSMKAYSGILRIGNFMRLCGLFESDQDFSIDEAKQYLAAYEFLLLNQKLGMTIQNSEFNKRHYTPFVRAMEYARQFCEKRNLLNEFVDLKKELEANRENDEAGHNRSGKIKVDLFLQMIVRLYRAYKEKMKETFKPVFDACNFLKKPLLEYDEFCILVKNIEPEKYDMKKLKEIYVNYKETSDSGSGISLDKFVVLALENEMFSFERQKKYVGAYDENEMKKSFEMVKEIWAEKKNRLEKVIEFSRRLHEPSKIEYWKKAVDSLEINAMAESVSDMMRCLINYRLLVTEMNSTFGVSIPLNKE